MPLSIMWKFDERCSCEMMVVLFDGLSLRVEHSYCISLDRKADDYTQDIFEAGGYAIIDHIEKLPEKLLLLFA